MKRFIAFAAAALISAITFAQDAPKPGEGPAKLSIEGEVNFTSAYFFRGFNIKDDGLIVQPELTLGYEAYKSDALTITPFVSLWANVTDETYTDDRKYFDELDVTAGVEFQVERFTLGFEYLFYNSPVNNFKNVHEVGFSLGFDDAGLTKLPFALNPYVALYQEIDNPDKIDEDTYLEFGIAPEFKVEKLPITLTTPITLGTALNEYYQNDGENTAFFGYVSVGLVAKYDINEHLYVKAGVEYIRLLADTVQAANDGDKDEIIGTVGFGFAY